MTPAQLITEQLDELRGVVSCLRAKAMQGDRAALDTYLEAQNRLVELLPYLEGYQPRPAMPVLEAPPPVESMRAPPLRSYYSPDERAADDLAEPLRTAVSFPPEPAFGLDDMPRQDEDY